MCSALTGRAAKLPVMSTHGKYFLCGASTVSSLKQVHILLFTFSILDRFIAFGFGKRLKTRKVRVKCLNPRQKPCGCRRPNSWTTVDEHFPWVDRLLQCIHNSVIRTAINLVAFSSLPEIVATYGPLQTPSTCLRQLWQAPT